VPVTYKIHPAHPLLMVTCFGEVTENDLYDFRSSVMLDPELQRTNVRLYDTRGVTKASFSPFTFWRMMSYAQPQPGLKRVFVLPRKGVDRFAYRLAVWLASGRANSHVCFELAEAVKWLGITNGEQLFGELVP
jgi:hypothetical protein